MNPLLLVVPLVLVAIAAVYGIVRAVGRVWLDHRIRLAILEKLQEKPQLLGSFHELQEVMTGEPERFVARERQDYALTGVILAVIGMGCAYAGRAAQSGRLAVGVYTGGLICIVLGVLLALVGLLLRWLSRPPLLSIPQEDSAASVSSDRGT